MRVSYPSLPYNYPNILRLSPHVTCFVSRVRLLQVDERPTSFAATALDADADIMYNNFTDYRC